jgi:hypothetical protein
MMHSMYSPLFWLAGYVALWLVFLLGVLYAAYKLHQKFYVRRSSVALYTLAEIRTAFDQSLGPHLGAKAVPAFKVFVRQLTASRKDS